MRPYNVEQDKLFINNPVHAAVDDQNRKSSPPPTASARNIARKIRHQANERGDKGDDMANK